MGISLITLKEPFSTATCHSFIFLPPRLPSLVFRSGFALAFLPHPFSCLPASRPGYSADPAAETISARTAAAAVSRQSRRRHRPGQKCSHVPLRGGGGGGGPVPTVLSAASGVTRCGPGENAGTHTPSRPPPVRLRHAPARRKPWENWRVEEMLSGRMMPAPRSLCVLKKNLSWIIFFGMFTRLRRRYTTRCS